MVRPCEDPELDDPRYARLCKEFPDMYHGNGTFVRAVAELVRLAHLNKKPLPKQVEWEMLARDICGALFHSCSYNILEQTCTVELRLGKMGEGQFREILEHLQKGELDKIKWPREGKPYFTKEYTSNGKR